MVLGIWLPLVIIISIASGAIGNGFRTEMELPDSDARVAQEMISKVSPSDGGESSQIVIKADTTIDDPATKAAFSAALTQVAKIPLIRVLSPYDVPTQVNQSRTIAFAQVTTPELLPRKSKRSQRLYAALTDFVLSMAVSYSASLKSPRAKHWAFLLQSSFWCWRSAPSLPWVFLLVWHCLVLPQHQVSSPLSAT
jgi:hypothetical protein